MRRSGFIIGMTVLLLLLVVLLAFHLYSTSKEGIVSQFQEHQLFHAQQIARQIESFLGARTHGLQILSSFSSLQYGDSRQKRDAIFAYFKQMQRLKVHVKGISISDQTGMVICSTSDDQMGVNYAKSEFFLWAKNKENKGKIFVSPLVQSPSHPFLLSIPIYQDAFHPEHPEPPGEFVGVLSLIIDLKELLAKQVDFGAADVSLHQAWIVDKGGRLLFQSKHPEMVSRSIHKRDESCNRCHISFDYAEKILREEEGTVDYQLKNWPKKIAAFAPIRFENAAWIVVVNSPYDKVTAFAKSSLWDHLLLIGIVFASFIIGSTLIIRFEKSRLKAAEEARHWHEIVTERQKAEQALQLERNKITGILDSMRDGVCIVNQNYDVEYVNPVIQREFGSVNGRKCHEYFNDQKEVCPWWRSEYGSAGKSVQWEWCSAKTNNIYELFDTPIIYEAGTVSKLEIFHDITGRRLAEKALQESEELHRVTLGNISDAVFLTNDAGGFEYICPNVDVIFGYTVEEVQSFGNISSLVGNNLFDHARLVSSGEIPNIARVISDKAGREHFLLVTVKSVSVKGGKILYVCRDITERKQAEDKIRESEEKYRMLVETMNEGLGAQDENGLWTYVNDKLCYMFGYFPGDIIGRPVDEFLDETNQNILKVQTERRRKRSAEPYEIEWTRKDGSKIPTITSPKPVFDVNSQFKGSFAVITDITERKRAEEALRHLSSQLLTIQEQERKRISKELHDELGQALAVLKIQQTHIEKSLHDDQEAIREECKESVQHIDQIIEDVRRLSRDLSPYTLEYFGLTAALKRLINDFTKNHKIEVTADITRVDPLFSKEKQIIIYRIFQETFNNIRKHAQAKHVTAVIRKDESGVFISVEDDGKGFNVAEMDLKDPAQKGLGFAILDERVRMLGGTLDLWSEGGKGTRISFTAPIQKIEKKVE